jgi:hypothetical protein
MTGTKPTVLHDSTRPANWQHLCQAAQGYQFIGVCSFLWASGPEVRDVEVRVAIAHTQPARI